MQSQITSIIRVFFAPLKVIVGTPKFIFKTNKVVVQVPYFMPKGSLVESQINALGTAIADSASTSEVVELRLIRLQYPYLDSSILAQYLALNARKYNFLRMKKRLFKKTPISSKQINLPTWISGVKAELAGRLTTQRNRPRKTVTNAHKGSFTVSNELSSSLNLSQYASKNKLGAYTMKVWLSQRDHQS